MPRGALQRSLKPLNATIGNRFGAAAEEGLCLACGLCCNGVIFADVRLQPGDNAERLRSLGLPLETVALRQGGAAGRPSRALRFCQPCAALEGCRCRLYGERPRHCREFECVLLKSVRAGRTSGDAALGIIRAAHGRAAEVRRLLRQLGDTDEQSPLASRFRQTARRVDQQGLDEDAAELYGRLTLAVHDLNLLLGDAFYPGPATDKPFAQTSATR